MILLLRVLPNCGKLKTWPGRHFLPGLVFSFLLLFPSLCVADADRMVTRARELRLHESDYWHTLLHYRPSWFGPHSLIDDPRFFMAEHGNERPERELEATIRGFFQPPASNLNEHPRCRFPARYAWIDEQLDLSSQLPPQACPDLEKNLAEIRPLSAELIFPGSNFNNPASMFGHTLISINGPYDSKLLSHALNYAAFTEEKNGIAYAVKGILGFYRGYYSLLPYYAKLKQYNDLERRDIWEYELNLDATEMERMLRHIWELDGIYSDYYFFDENCAYQLLFLFDIARPSLRLVDQARPWVIPVDTVRILEDNGLISAAEYRPSKATRIAWIVRHMSDDEKEAAEDILGGKKEAATIGESGFGEAGRVRVLDLAIETLEFQYLKHELERPEYRKRYLELLKQRSYQTPVVSAVPEIPVPVRPDRGHGSNRISLQGGESGGEAFAEIRIRPAYHSLLDADEGYLAGSEIEFANITARHYTGPDQTRLEAFDLVSIVSLAPRHRFYRPVSWKVKAGLKRELLQDRVDRLIFSLNPGGGFTFGNDTGLAFVLFETDLQLSRHFRDGYMLGFGGSAGLVLRVGPSLKLRSGYRQIAYVSGDGDRAVAAGDLGLNVKLSANSSLVLEFEREYADGYYKSEIKGGINYYW